MATPTYSLWDTLVDLRRPRMAAFGFKPSIIREKRCELRTSEYAGAVATGITPEWLANDLAARRGRWESHLDDTDEETEPKRDWSWFDIFSVGWDELILGAAILAAILFAVFGLVLLIVWIPLHILRVIRRTRCRRAIHHNHCPDCSYDLTGVPDEIEPENIRSQHTGPARCPECASPWPLLPPPARFR